MKALQADHGVQWADFDRDGDLDLALTGARRDGMHSLMRNELGAELAQRSLAVSVVDARGRATLPGAEVRVYAAGTRRLLGTRLVDTGSGYDAQSVTPMHFGLPSLDRVDVEVIVPRGGQRVLMQSRGIDPRRYRGQPLVVRIAR